MILVWSNYRRIRLRTPPPEGSTRQILGIPAGSTDLQVLDWAAELLSPQALAELRQIIQQQAQSGEQARSAPAPAPPAAAAGDQAVLDAAQ